MVLFRRNWFAAIVEVVTAALHFSFESANTPPVWRQRSERTWLNSAQSSRSADRCMDGILELLPTDIQYGD